MSTESTKNFVAPTLEESLAFQVSMVKKYLREDPDGTIPPTFSGFTMEGDKFYCITPWEGPEERDGYLATLRSKFQSEEVIQYSFVSETWLVVRSPEEGMPKGSLSECPDRKEGVLVIVSDQYSSRIAILEIIRDQKGLVKDLKPITEEGDEGCLENPIGALLSNRVRTVH